MTRSRYGFVLLAYAFAVVMLGTTLPTPMYALYAVELHFEVLTTTVIYATYAVGVLAALLCFGRWSDAIGRRPVLLAGAVAAVLSAVVFLFADSVPILLVGRLLSGLSAGIFTGTATAAVIEAAPESWRGRAPVVATIVNIGGLGAGPDPGRAAGAVRRRPVAAVLRRAHRADGAGGRRNPDRSRDVATRRKALASNGFRCLRKLVRFSSSRRLRRSPASR